MPEPARYIAVTKANGEIENTFAVGGNTTLDELFEKLRELNVYNRPTHRVSIHRDALERHREDEGQFSELFGHPTENAGDN